MRTTSQPETQAAWLRLAVRAANVGLWDWEPGTDRAYFSPEWKRQVGCGDHEVTSRFEEWRRRLHPDDSERVLAALHGYLAQPWEEYQDEFRFRHQDGSYRWILAQGAIVHGTPARFVGAHLDITERKQAEAVLRASEERLRLAQQVARVGVFEWNIQTGLNTWTRELEVMHGLPAGGFPGTQPAWENLVHPDDRAAALAKVRQALAGTEPVEGEWRVVWPDGSTRWIFGRFQVLRDAAGQPLRLIGVNLDITERTQVEAALRASRDWAADIINSVEGIVWEADPETFAFSFVSRQAEAILGYPAEHWLTEPNFWASKLHPEDRERAVSFCLNETRAGRSHQFEYRMLAADGRVVWLKDFVTVVHSAGRVARLRGIMVDTTERKRADTALTEAEAKYRSIFENAVDGIFQTTPDGRFLAANPAMAAIFGYASPAELMAERTDISRQGYADPDQREEFKRLLTTQDSVSGFEYEALRRDGSRVWVSESARAVRDEAGGIVCYEGSMKDISGRKRIEQSLRANEEKFQAFFEASPDAIIVATRAGVIHTINRQAEQMFGYTRAELAGQAIETLMPARLQAGHLTQREGYLREPHIRPMGESRDLFARRKDGSEFPVDISLSPITTAEGLMVISTIRDITKRKQAEEQLRQAEAKYRAIFDNSVEGIVQTNPSGRIITANPTLARLLGFDTPEQLLAAGLNMDRDVHVNPGDRTSLLRRARVSGRDFIQCQFKRRDGQLIWVALNLRAVRDAQGEPLYFEGTCVDITERRHLEEQLRQSQKMEAMGQLAGGIAHDFNNILGAILGNAELLRLLPAGSKEAGECLDAVLAASRRAGDLVRQILAFSRRQEIQREPVQLHLVVREALALLRATVPATVEFRSHIAVTPTVLANASEIHQVTMNLCTNAWHALRGGAGIIQVELAETEVGEALARQQPDLRPGRYVRLTVADNGCGMGAAMLQRIFEPFFTTKPAGVGTGLGLAVVHGIVKSHDGGIVVSSEPGRGTTFALYFPVFEAEVVEPPTTPQPVLRGRGEHVLFVDDEEPLARMGRAALERLGYRVTALTSPVAAVALFSVDPAQFDLVITDLNMPGLNGTELGRRLLAIRADLRLVLTTGYSAAVTGEVAHELGFRELLPKPYDLRSLGEVTHRALNETTLTRRP